MKAPLPNSGASQAAATTSYQYDPLGNLTQTAAPLGRTTSSQYDANGNKISDTDALGRVTSYQYDALNRLITTTYPDSTSSTRTYDFRNNVVDAVDEAGHDTHNTYDLAGRLISATQAYGTSNVTTTTYAYDADGRKQSETDALGHTTAYTYDAAGNLTAVSGVNGNFQYGYDNARNRVSMTDASGTTNYTYDSLDRLITKATPEGTLNYSYDAAGNLASMASSDGNVSVAYTWDNLNRLSTVADSRLSGQNTTTYTYDAASNLATATYPNGLESTFNYDQLNRMTSMTASTTAYMYQLGPTGNRTGAIELGGRTTSWSYDGIYRLTQETISSDPGGKNGSAAYGLDPVGNRLSATSTLPGVAPGTFSFNVDDELSAETYDADGNVTAAGGKTFAYDSEDRLKSMNGGTVSIVYDGDGNRVAKTVSGVTTRYLVDDLNPTGYAQVIEETVNGAAERTYTYGLQRIDENQVVNGAWTPSFYGYDGIGSVRLLTNAAGATTDTYEYDAFGNELNHTGTTPNNLLYRGEEFDPDLGLYYLRARYMNPLTGRFLSRDPNEPKLRGPDGTPIDPKGLHKYLYANGDPVNRIDPKGKDAIVNYALELGDDEATAAELRVTGQLVREELLNACVDLQMPAFEAGGVPSPAAYDLALALCTGILD